MEEAPSDATGSDVSELRLRWHVFRCRRKSDTKTRFLRELARVVARAPRPTQGKTAPPLLEIGTSAGGSALLMLRVLDDVYRGGHPPFVLTVDPYGARPYEGAPFVYEARPRPLREPRALHDGFRVVSPGARASVSLGRRGPTAPGQVHARLSGRES